MVPGEGGTLSEKSICCGFANCGRQGTGLGELTQPGQDLENIYIGHACLVISASL